MVGRGGGDEGGGNILGEDMREKLSETVCRAVSGCGAAQPFCVVLCGHSTILYGAVGHSTILWGSVVHAAIFCGTVGCSAIFCEVVVHSTILCRTVVHAAILCGTVRSLCHFVWGCAVTPPFSIRLWGQTAMFVRPCVRPPPFVCVWTEAG